MKKLMIAAAIVCAAVVSQAAQATWKANNLYAGNSTDKGSGYIGYFVDSAAYDLTSAKSDLAGGSYADILNAAQADSVMSFNTSGAQTTAKGFGSYDNGETVTGYLLIFNASTVADATKAYLSGELSADTGAEGQAALLNFNKLNGTNTSGAVNPDSRLSGSWYAIPEPTSGLLLLLGVAGLALKRRRA